MTREEAIKHITAWMYAASDLTPKQVAEALDFALTALRGPTREMVEKAWKGEWILHENKDDVFSSYHTCSRCGSKFGEASHIDVFHLDFCPVCHAAMTDEAVDMMLERWKEALDGETH